MQHISDRMYERRWGVFNHFLYGNPGSELPDGPDLSDWNERVNNFDVERVAKDLHEIGAGWYFITLMQGRKYMLAPNATFDRIAGTKPGEACAKRDLVLDLYEALKKYDIDLCLYFTGDGPYKDVEIGKRFGFAEPRGKVTKEFVDNWAAVLEEYAVRYGDKVKAWWLDGMYGEFFGYTNELMEPYYRAIKKGNPNALTAFNNGVFPDIRKWYEHEEMTCGEFNDLTYIPSARYIDGAQAFILAPLGIAEDPANIWGRWCRPGASHDHDYLKNYVERVHEAGGVVTIDIKISADSSWDPEQIRVLKGI